MSANFLDERLPVRFWEKAHPCPVSGCWLWAACTGSDGYGRIKIGGAMKMAHRVAFASLVREIPATLQIDHLCRVRACCNPVHLEAVTYTENQLRSPLTLIHRRSNTHCIRGHEFTFANTGSDNGRRVCRACDRNRHRAIRAGEVLR